MQGNRAIDILIADDDAEDLELIEEAILSFEPNAQLHMVNDGKAAVDYLATLQDHNLPALIILDYNMPQLKGSEVLLHLGTQSRYNAVPSPNSSPPPGSFENGVWCSNSSLTSNSFCSLMRIP